MEQKIIEFTSGTYNIKCEVTTEDGELRYIAFGVVTKGKNVLDTALSLNPWGVEATNADKGLEKAMSAFSKHLASEYGKVWEEKPQMNDIVEPKAPTE